MVHFSLGSLAFALDETGVTIASTTTTFFLEEDLLFAEEVRGWDAGVGSASIFRFFVGGSLTESLDELFQRIGSLILEFLNNERYNTT
jgi:hypothetical protein